MPHRMKVLFWQRKNKTTITGKSPIYCRITVNGIRAKEFSTGVSVLHKEWNAKKQVIVNNPIKQGILNQLRHQADTFYLEMVISNNYPSPEAIKNKLKQQHEFITIKWLGEDFYIEYTRANDCQSTHKKQKTYLNNFNLFLKEKGLQNAPCQSFSNAELERFKQFLLNKNFNPLTINKHLSFVRNTIKHGVRKGIINTYNLVIDNVKLINKLPVYLLKEDLEKLCNYVGDKRNERVRDCFMFQCYTGFAYADLKAFDYQKHIITEKASIVENKINVETYTKWILKAREKTAVKSHLPLLEKAEKLLQKYNYKMPVISAQKYNKYISELGTILEIKIRLTSHVARKTFGSIMLNNGVSLETVSSMLGHDKIETTQKYYAKVDKRRVMGEMQLIQNAA